MIASKTYKESEKINLIKQTVSYLILLLIILYISYVYCIIIILVPIIYLKVLFTFGFGIVIGSLARVSFRFSHNRSKKSRYILAITLPLIATLFQWATYFTYLILNRTPSFPEFIKELKITLLPQNFISIISEIYEYGTWGFGSSPVNGYLLLLIWFIELGITIAIPFLFVKDMKPSPYSEMQNKWYPKLTLKKDFESIPASIKLSEDLINSPMDTINNLKSGSGHRHTKIHIYYLKEENKQYLTFEKISIVGKGSKKSVTLINNFEISNNIAENILEKYKFKKERFDLF